MDWWNWVHLVLSLGLFGVSIYGHVQAQTLLLPISSFLTIFLIIVIPLFLVNTMLYAPLARSQRATRTRMLAAFLLQRLQLIVVASMATSFSFNITSSTIRKCLLSTRWQQLFSAHDADSIRRIQDAFQCCGFATVRDRPWPFPDHHSSGQCVDTYHRQISCFEPWQASLQQTSGIEFGVILAVGLIQVVNILRVSFFTESSATSTPRFLRLQADEAERARLLPAADFSEANITGDGVENNSTDQGEAGREPRAEEANHAVEQHSENPWG